jgi:hypothetical protein
MTQHHRAVLSSGAATSGRLHVRREVRARGWTEGSGGSDPAGGKLHVRGDADQKGRSGGGLVRRQVDGKLEQGVRQRRIGRPRGVETMNAPRRKEHRLQEAAEGQAPSRPGQGALRADEKTGLVTLPAREKENISGTGNAAWRHQNGCLPFVHSRVTGLPCRRDTSHSSARPCNGPDDG